MPRLTFAVLIAFACTLGGCADKGAGKPTPAAAVAASQDDALQQAQDADLPALRTADRAVVTEAPPPMGSGKSFEITDAEQLRRLVDALKPAKVTPSAGKEAMTVRFYEGPTLRREVWVFENGEWGFRRPGTGWTTGRSNELVRVIRQELSRVPAAE